MEFSRTVTKSWLMAKGQSGHKLVDGERKCHVRRRAFSFNLKGQSRAIPVGGQSSRDADITYIKNHSSTHTFKKTEVWVTECNTSKIHQCKVNSCIFAREDHHSSYSGYKHFWRQKQKKKTGDWYAYCTSSEQLSDHDHTTNLQHDWVLSWVPSGPHFSDCLCGLLPPSGHSLGCRQAALSRSACHSESQEV